MRFGIVGKIAFIETEFAQLRHKIASPRRALRCRFAPEGLLGHARDVTALRAALPIIETDCIAVNEQQHYGADHRELAKSAKRVVGRVEIDQ